MKNRAFVENNKFTQNLIKDDEFFNLFDEDIPSNWYSIDDETLDKGGLYRDEGFPLSPIPEADFYDGYNYDRWVN